MTSQLLCTASPVFCILKSLRTHLAPPLLLATALFLGACSQPDSQESAVADVESPPETSWSTPENPQAAAYLAECATTYREATQQFHALESLSVTDGGTTMLQEMNHLEQLLDRGAAKASLYRNVHPSESVRAVADECEQKFNNLISEISLSSALYNQVAGVDTTTLKPLDLRYVDHLLRDFKRAGVNLDEKSRARVKALNEEILLLGQTFNKNIRDDVRTLSIQSADRLKGLPEDYISAHQPDTNGQITLNTTYPDYIPVMQYAVDDDLRLQLYKIFRQRGYPQNEKVLKDLLTKRYELARLLGYGNYAEYAMAELMIGSPGAAENFINRINTLAKPASAHDYQILLTRLQQIDPGATTVGDWQKTYLEEKIKAEKYQVDSQQIRQYFSFANVKKGIFDLTESLFGVRIQPWNTDVWDPSVNAYEMYEGDRLIGRFFLDMHPREGKYSHAAAFGIQDGIEGVQPPIAALVCNFPGAGDGSALMEHSQVETFLHEFGHLLHIMFGGHQQYLYFSGVKTEHDFVEAPSQMLEEWVWDAATLKTFARNSKGEVIPDALIKKMNAGRDFGKALWVRHQMFYAAVSLNLYNQNPADMDLAATMIRLQGEYSPFPYVEDTYFHTAFGHLYGYSAAYYTYMWSLVIAADMFSEFERYGLRNTEVAQRYRDNVLAPGGSKDAAELVHDFLGRDYSFKTFADQFEVSKP